MCFWHTCLIFIQKFLDFFHEIFGLHIEIPRVLVYNSISYNEVLSFAVIEPEFCRRKKPGMPIQLFAHNERAYEAALDMLYKTGKFFIGFELCEDYPESTVSWLSTSEYIFQTQVENLKSTGADVLENIKFFTYAKLANMNPAEMEEIQPNYIICYEFHRAGAAIWSIGVQNLLQTYPNVPVLGLSATHIRYLDNQRNMAEELFDGNIAQ